MFAAMVEVKMKTLIADLEDEASDLERDLLPQVSEGTQTLSLKFRRRDPHWLSSLTCPQIMAFRLLLCWGQVVRDARMDLRLPPEGALPGQRDNARTRISRLSGSIVIPSAFATREVGIMTFLAGALSLKTPATDCRTLLRRSPQ